MSLTADDVRKVALLARLELTEEEVTSLTEQMGAILGYMDLLSELDTENVQPMAHAVEINNVFREDEVKESLPREEALKNAPNSDGEFYLVPAVLE